MSETRHTVHKRKVKKLGSIEPGTMFIAAFGNLYIKVQYGLAFNALRVNDGSVVDLPVDVYVEPVARAEYHLYEEE